MRIQVQVESESVEEIAKQLEFVAQRIRNQGESPTWLYDTENQNVIGEVRWG